MIAWSLCAFNALTTYKPHRIVHNSVGVIQSLSVLPVIWAACASLAAAARLDREQLSSPCCRRLHLGLVAASIWSAAAVVWSPVFTAAQV
jgi:hypothetical protein